ncbi:hypothetical protein, partial [Burkholderia multivorans]|uniref:hypothetical protein n=1 Tax=Burkholderia multivorans TaxID=87883 RepID=UPI001C2713AE
VRPEYERNSPRMSSNSYVNLKIATCLVRYADDRLIDQRFPSNRLRWTSRESRISPYAPIYRRNALRATIAALNGNTVLVVNSPKRDGRGEGRMLVTSISSGPRECPWHREVLRFHSAFLLVTFLWQDKEK